MKPGYTKFLGRTTLATSLLAAALLAGCGGSQEEQGSEGEQGSQGGTAAPSGETTTAMSGGSTNAQGGDATPQVVAAAEGFLATLDDAQREQATFAFDDDAQRTNWSNFPTGIFERSGVRTNDLNDEQRQAANELLATVLSEEGYQKVMGIVYADEVLEQTDSGAGGGGAPPGDGTGGPPAGGPPGGGTGGPPGGGGLNFGSEEYYFAFLGTPSETEPWGMQFGGHHLGVNVTVVGEDIVLTPTLDGAQPAEYTLDQAGDEETFVPDGVLQGPTVRPMADENDLAFELINALDAEQQEQAILDYDVSALVLGADEEGRALEPEGLAASEMDADQQQALLDVAREWVGLVNDEDAAAKMAEVEANLDELYFAWSGGTENGDGVYYRITGPNLHIEFNHEENDTGHIHAIYRDPRDEYGESSISEQ